MAKAVRISLANKCQLLFGAAVLLILSAALAVGWWRMQTLVTEGQEEGARKLANACIEGIIRPAGMASKLELGLTLRRLDRDDMELEAPQDAFLAEAIAQFKNRSDRNEWFRPARDSSQRYYRYARAIRKADLDRVSGAGQFAPRLDLPASGSSLEGVVLVQMSADAAQKQLVINGWSVVVAGLLAGLLAIGVFWFITTRLILSPVRVLRDTAQKVSEGDLNIRADVNTGDEFEQLSDSFNSMLASLKSNQDQLRSINKSLDLKLGELAQSNMTLFESNKIKGEFLANVSHELRTPLNSIIGFAEVLEETLKDRTGPVDEKRKRYAANIITSSRRLLDLINEVLDLAKIEAGRVDVRVSPMSVADSVEGLVNLIRPQAEKKQVELLLNLAPQIPLVQTDAGKFHQIVFNFLSNAVKFTPPGGKITVAAEAVAPTPAVASAGSMGATAVLTAPAGAAVAAPDAAPLSTAPVEPQRVRVSVSDSGPGIPLDQHERVFEKFTQLDSTVTKEHGGTGLGLAISKELARLLQGRIELDSDTGKGATFSLVIPVTLESRSVPLMPDLVSEPSRNEGGAASSVAPAAAF
jgi:two-component system, NarL family, sensor histidine kinase BarA